MTTPDRLFGGIAVEILMFKTRLEIETENLSKVLNKRGSQLAKLASPSGVDAMKRYTEGATRHIMAEWNAALRKGANVADRAAIMKAAAESYFASATSPLTDMQNEIADLKAEMDMIAEGLQKMRAAFPAFKRWALNGITDPNGIDVKPPGYDPQAPVIDHGGVRIAEKSYRIEDGKRTEPTFSEVRHAAATAAAG